jgi:hypothetical protein
MRDDATTSTTTTAGSRLTWRGERLDLADVHRPGDTAPNGRHRQLLRAGERSEYDYDEALPDEYWSPSARGDGSTRAAWTRPCFPNFGLLWERRLSGSPGAHRQHERGTVGAAIIDESGGRLHPVAHLTLRDPEWLTRELRALADAGVRRAMIAPLPSTGARCPIRPRRHLVGVRAPRHHARVPCRRPTAGARRLLVHG